MRSQEGHLPRAGGWRSLFFIFCVALCDALRNLYFIKKIVMLISQLMQPIYV